jgi:hypothetical protein
VKATLENIIDFTNSHKTKGKTAISCICMMTSMVNFSSLCFNMNTIITAICSNNEPLPVLCQILLNFVAIINNLIGYIGMKVWEECNCFIGTPTVFLSKSSIALPILLQILAMETLCPRVAQSSSLIPKH